VIVTTCPCCNSLVRVERDDTLEIVRIAKPVPGEEWKPTPTPHPKPQPEPIPLDVAKAVRSAVEEKARLVIERVGYAHGFTLPELRSTSRAADLVAARWAAAAAARSETEASLPQIGRLLNRDHSTILHALRKIGATA
jgi:hypothetical protein